MLFDRTVNDFTSIGSDHDTSMIVSGNYDVPNFVAVAGDIVILEFDK